MQRIAIVPVYSCYGGANRESVIAAICFMVYFLRMSRTSVNIDDEACAEVMRRYQLTTMSEAINLALRRLVAEPMSLEEARSLRGSGWDGDLNAMRSERIP